MNDKNITDLHNEITKKIYEKELNKALADAHLSNEEKDFLNNLKNDLALPEEISEDIYRTTTNELMQKIINEISEDNRISPEEEKYLETLKDNLNVNFVFENNSKLVYEKMKLFWKIENGDLPIVSTDLALQKNEICHYSTSIKWFENRAITKRINYGGPSMSLKIAKGVYWRSGSMNVQRISEDVLTLIDSGMVYLTNKRVIFMGNKGNKTINLNKILDFDYFTNGITIQKDTGKSPFLLIEENADLFSLILGQCIKFL